MELMEVKLIDTGSPQENQKGFHVVVIQSLGQKKNSLKKSKKQRPGGADILIKWSLL